MFVGTGTSSMVNCTVFGNVCKGGHGGSGISILNGLIYGPDGHGIGGGVYIQTNALSLLNSIVAGNLGDNSSDGRGSFVSQGYNLIGNTNGTSGFMASDLLSVAANIGPLQDNGGPTLTHALLPGSPAIDAGTVIGAPSLDQRGFPRPAGAGFDIGAYEYGSVYERIQYQNGKAQVWFMTEPNQTYPILATTNFLDWQMIGTIPATSSGQFLFEDNPNLPFRFYKIVPSP